MLNPATPLSGVQGGSVAVVVLAVMVALAGFWWCSQGDTNQKSPWHPPPQDSSYSWPFGPDPKQQS